MEKKGFNTEMRKAKERANNGKQSSVKYAPKSLKKDGKSESK